MNIKSIQCPNCGGTLNIENINQSLFYCQYCGAAVQLETNRNKGYDMEHGRLDARGEMADAVLEKIEKIRAELIRNGRAEHDVKYYPGRISELKADLSVSFGYELKDYILKPFLKGLGLLFLGAFVVVCISSLVSKPVLYAVEALVGFAPIYFPVIGTVMMFRKRSMKRGEISQCKECLKEAKKEFEESSAYLEKNAEVEIPPRFRQEVALNYITKGLKAREFVSLEQALFRCDEAMARGEVPSFINF